MAKGNKNSARAVLAREREQRAMELRKAGKSYPKIGAELGVTDEAARKMVGRVIDHLERATAEDAAEMRRLETERIDAMLAALWRRAELGEIDAVTTVLKLQARRADLWGLDAPRQTVVSGPNGAPVFKVYVKQAGFDPEEA